MKNDKWREDAIRKSVRNNNNGSSSRKVVELSYDTVKRKKKRKCMKGGDDDEDVGEKKCSKQNDGRGENATNCC